MQVSPATPNGAPKVIFAALDAAIAAELEPQVCRGRVRRGLELERVAHGSGRAAGDSGSKCRAREADRDPSLAKESGGFMVTNPNCSAIGLVIALAPLDRAFGLDTVMAVTMQAVSGAGYPGVASLDILGNVIPYIAKEEEKMEEETQKAAGPAERTHVWNRRAFE